MHVWRSSWARSSRPETVLGLRTLFSKHQVTEQSSNANSPSFTSAYSPLTVSRLHVQDAPEWSLEPLLVETWPNAIDGVWYSTIFLIPAVITSTSPSRHLWSSFVFLLRKHSDQCRGASYSVSSVSQVGDRMRMTTDLNAMRESTIGRVDCTIRACKPRANNPAHYTTR